jgi:hypothetical protein
MLHTEEIVYWKYNGTVPQLFIDSRKACDTGEKYYEDEMDGTCSTHET